MKRTSRQPSKLSHSVHHQLNMYAIAASAAGIAALALAQPSEAKIVYTKTHHVIGWNRAYQLDLNHDGIIDFLILHFGSSSRSGGTLSAKEAFGNAIEGSWVGTTRGSSAFPYDAALKPGTMIGPGQGFITCPCNGELMAQFGGGDWRGNWANVRNRYLGLRFQIHGKNHYGWARLSVQLDRKRRLTALVTGYAYETLTDKGLRAGQTTSDDAFDPVALGPQQSDLQNMVVREARPESTSLGALALGAQGVPDGRNQ
jgi:hypothetical protein